MLISVVFLRGEESLPYLLRVFSHGVFYEGGGVCVAFGEAGGPFGEADHVVEHQYLAVAVGARAYTYGGHVDGLGHLLGQRGGDELQHDGEDAGVSEGLGVF